MKTTTRAAGRQGGQFEMLATEGLPAGPQPKRDGTWWRAFILRYAILWILIVVIALANVLYPQFIDPSNLSLMLDEVCSVGVVALGMTFVIIGGSFDLSVTAVFAGAAVIYADLSNKMPLEVAFLITMIAGALMGVANGVVVTRLKVNSFIATLATSSLISGATYLVFSDAPVSSNVASFGDLGQDKFGGIWISVYVMCGMIVVLGVILARTPFGRSVYAVGGNAEAARLAGMRINIVRIATFAITSSCAAIGGMITASQTGVGQADIGPTITLNAIAIVVIGGTSIFGGEGAMWRTVVGILIWGTVSDVFASLAMSSAEQALIQGGILLFAVSLDGFARLRRS